MALITCGAVLHSSQTKMSRGLKMWLLYDRYNFKKDWQFVHPRKCVWRGGSTFSFILSSLLWQFHMQSIVPEPLYEMEVEECVCLHVCFHPIILCMHAFHFTSCARHCHCRGLIITAVCASSGHIVTHGVKVWELNKSFHKLHLYGQVQKGAATERCRR